MAIIFINLQSGSGDEPRRELADGQREGIDGHQKLPDRQREGIDGHQKPPDRQRERNDGHQKPPDRQREGNDGHQKPPDNERIGFDGHRQFAALRERALTGINGHSGFNTSLRNHTEKDCNPTRGKRYRDN